MERRKEEEEIIRRGRHRASEYSYCLPGKQRHLWVEKWWKNRGTGSSLSAQSSSGDKAWSTGFHYKMRSLYARLSVRSLFRRMSHSVVKNPPEMQEMQHEPHFQSLGQDPLQKEMATYFSILAWEIPQTEEPGRLQTTGSQRVVYDLVIKQQQSLVEM